MGFRRRRYAMPKLNARPPKYCKFKSHAVVYYQGKTYYLGSYGSSESKAAYSRFIAEIQMTPAFFPARAEKEEKQIVVHELSAAFLDHAEANMNSTNYTG